MTTIGVKLYNFPSSKGQNSIHLNVYICIYDSISIRTHIFSHAILDDSKFICIHYELICLNRNEIKKEKKKQNKKKLENAYTFSSHKMIVLFVNWSNFYILNDGKPISISVSIGVQFKKLYTVAKYIIFISSYFGLGLFCWLI